MRARALDNLRNRRNPDGLLKEAYASIQEDDAVRYLVGAMQPVEDSWTKKSIEAGDRVSKQIQSALERRSLGADYRYQGSVTKNTHIKAHSDLDLLVIEKRFYCLEPPQVANPVYLGDPIKDLLEIRAVCITSLRDAYPAATVDSGGARSVKISGGSLNRTVDIVPSNWFDTNDYAKYRQEVFRGVHILDAHKPDREADQPFVHGALIGLKDDKTKGNARRLIRLLKSLKYDSEGDVTISSFDIEALIYAMPDGDMQKERGQEIPQAHACWLWLKQVEDNQAVREGLNVPDAKRKIFAAGKATLAQLIALRKELETLLYQVNQGLQRSFRKLADARVAWPEISPARFLQR